MENALRNELHQASVKLLNRFAGLALLLLLNVLLNGCGMIYKSAGNITASYVDANLVPYVMSSTDVPMSCATGTSLNQLMMSFSESGAATEKVGVFQFALAAYCVEDAALEAELDSLRAISDQNASLAKDARIRQQRLLALAAQRQYAAYRNGLTYFGLVTPEQMTNFHCPELGSETDQVAWLLAMLSGLQAVINNMGANSIADIPKDVLKDVIQGSYCIDNERWWYLPQAIRGGLWTIAPALNQVDDPWKLLADAAAKGLHSGVRLANAVHLMTAATNSNEALMRDIIRKFSQAKPNPAAKDYILLDKLALGHARRASDRLWTKHTGSRTPLGGFGTFWDDKKVEAEGIELDDL